MEITMKKPAIIPALLFAKYFCTKYLIGLVDHKPGTANRSSVYLFSSLFL